MRNAGPDNILILVADDDEEMRQFVASVLESHGLFVIQAINSGAAIKVIEEWDVDVAVIAYRMKPHDGFEIAKHVLVKKYNTGLIMLAKNPGTDLLLRAGQNGIAQVMRKPVEPDRLANAVKHMIRAQGKNPNAMGPDKVTSYTPEELMNRVIALASQNALSKMGGPFAAVVADKEGHILGEGVNGVKRRCDPTAHAEILAIRRATEKTNNIRLDEGVIYCSSEPTMLGQALIIGTGIKKVYYGISHKEAGTPRIEEEGIIGEISKPLDQRTILYEQLQHEDAMKVFQNWRRQEEE